MCLYSGVRRHGNRALSRGHEYLIPRTRVLTRGIWGPVYDERPEAFSISGSPTLWAISFTEGPHQSGRAIRPVSILVLVPYSGSQQREDSSVARPNCPTSPGQLPLYPGPMRKVLNIDRQSTGCRLSDPASLPACFLPLCARGRAMVNHCSRDSLFPVPRSATIATPEPALQKFLPPFPALSATPVLAPRLLPTANHERQGIDSSPTGRCPPQCVPYNAVPRPTIHPSSISSCRPLVAPAVYADDHGK